MKTIAQIKRTNLYKTTLPKVLAIWPDKAEEYAKELAIAQSSILVRFNRPTLIEAFIWSLTPQGHKAWHDMHQML